MSRMACGLRAYYQGFPLHTVLLPVFVWGFFFNGGHGFQILPNYNILHLVRDLVPEQSNLFTSLNFYFKNILNFSTYNRFLQFFKLPNVLADTNVFNLSVFSIKYGRKQLFCHSSLSSRKKNKPEITLVSGSI